MSAWLSDLQQWNGDTNDPAFVAFREMGSNAVPALVQILQSGGPRWQRAIAKFNRKQSIVHLPFGEPEDEGIAASWALCAMGSKAALAIPALTNLLFHTNALFKSAPALAGIGTEAVPVLLTALTNQSYRIRHAAAFALGMEKASLNIVVPALMDRLDDSDGLVRHAAARSLGWLHSQPDTVVPKLVTSFKGADVLGRTMILNSLGRFETNATAALPIVVESLSDSDVSVSNSAAAALKLIDPTGTARAGLK
jgi:HEAT repeat protein